MKFSNSSESPTHSTPEAKRSPEHSGGHAGRESSDRLRERVAREAMPGTEEMMKFMKGLALELQAVSVEFKLDTQCAVEARKGLFPYGFGVQTTRDLTHLQAESIRQTELAERREAFTRQKLSRVQNRLAQIQIGLDAWIKDGVITQEFSHLIEERKNEIAAELEQKQAWSASEPDNLTMAHEVKKSAGRVRSLFELLQKK